MAGTAIKYWTVQLDDAAERNPDRTSFHVFAEGMHSDVRGQIHNFSAASEFSLPHELWPNHLFIVIGIIGEVEVRLPDKTLELRPLSQLVVVPSTPCTLTAKSAASVEIISLLSMRPVVQNAG